MYARFQFSPHRQRERERERDSETTYWRYTSRIAFQGKPREPAWGYYSWGGVRWFMMLMSKRELGKKKSLRDWCYFPKLYPDGSCNIAQQFIWAAQHWTRSSWESILKLGPGRSEKGQQEQKKTDLDQTILQPRNFIGFDLILASSLWQSLDSWNRARRELCEMMEEPRVLDVRVKRWWGFQGRYVFVLVNRTGSMCMCDWKEGMEQSWSRLFGSNGWIVWIPWPVRKGGLLFCFFFPGLFGLVISWFPISWRQSPPQRYYREEECSSRKCEFESPCTAVERYRPWDWEEFICYEPCAKILLRQSNPDNSFRFSKLFFCFEMQTNDQKIRFKRH